LAFALPLLAGPCLASTLALALALLLPCPCLALALPVLSLLPLLALALLALLTVLSGWPSCCERGKCLAPRRRRPIQRLLTGMPCWCALSAAPAASATLRASRVILPFRLSSTGFALRIPRSYAVRPLDLLRNLAAGDGARCFLQPACGVALVVREGLVLS